jgi:hypothetical protein
MIEVIVNQLSADGMKFVKMISDQRMSEAWVRSIVPGAAREFAQVKCYETSALSLFYGEVSYPLRQMVEIKPAEWKRARRFAGWRLMDGEGYRVSEIIEFLGEWYFVQTHQRAQYAFVKSLPKGAERFMELDGLMLLDVEWALDKCVLIGG